MTPRGQQAVFAFCMVALSVVTVVALRGTMPPGPRNGDGDPASTSGFRKERRRPVRIMGTRTELIAVAPASRNRRIFSALSAAEQALRDVEARMSQHIDASELSRLNAARAREVCKLSGATLDLLRLCRDITGQTDGAFDATCRPILQVWRKAGKTKRLPADADLAGAIRQSGWDKIELLAGGARKTVDGAGADLGGIAKGFGIDRAIDAMRNASAAGGLVNVGGDVRCFGRREKEGRWLVGIRGPFDGRRDFAVVQLTDAAVCTSGNYERFFEIDGKRYSHIVDPRTGRTVDCAPSVTVVAPTAAVADAWATALSVLGEAGLKLLPEDGGIEAMLVIGTPEEYHVRLTPGLERLFAKPPGCRRKR